MSKLQPKRAQFKAATNAMAALCLGWLAGCSFLPTTVPEMSIRPPLKPVVLKDGQGALSEQQSKAILSRLSAGDSSIFDRHLAIEQAIVGSPLVVGNEVQLLQDGPATLQSMFDAIGKAKDHINMETYIIEDDEVGNRFADAFIEKQEQGVQVNLIYDSVGSLHTPREFFARLADNGIKLLEFNPVNPLTAKKGWEVNQRDHRKLLIVDGQVVFLGGVNISSVYSTGSAVRGRKAVGDEKKIPWRDTELRVEGPIVGEFQKLFMETWTKQKGEPLPEKKYFPQLGNKGKEVVRAIGSSPDEPYSLIHGTLVSAIRNAESTVYLTNAYFAPDPELLAVLKEAAGRGVDVRLILPSSTDSWLAFHTGRSHYSELLRAGVKIYERRDALLHAKTAVIDGVWSTVGSTNLDWRSFVHNDEINAVILGPDFGARMHETFDKDLESSTLITLKQWRQRSLGQRIEETVARAWEYWL